MHTFICTSIHSGKFFYGLDATNPAVKEYVRKTIYLAVETWGFQYLKLDFLYSAVLGARDGTLMDRSKSGAQAMSEGMDLIKQTLLSIKRNRQLDTAKQLASSSSSSSSSKGRASNDSNNNNDNDDDDDDDVTLLGCGAALGSTIGKVHINRISADAGLTWHPSLGPIPISDKWNLPSATNMIRNTITRLCMHNRWWINDPDCIIMRKAGAYTHTHTHTYV